MGWMMTNDGRLWVTSLFFITEIGQGTKGEGSLLLVRYNVAA